MKHLIALLGFPDADRPIPTLLPEHRLYAAILVQAVQDALGKGFSEKHIKLEARFWLGLDLEKWYPNFKEEPIAFEEVCEILELCPKTVHRALRELDGDKYQLKRRKIITKLEGLLGWD
jgi:hypothetical protein